MKKARFLFLCWLVLLLWAPVLKAEPNPYETKILRKQVMTQLMSLMDMWKEELYFDMYDLGQRAAKKRLSKAEFAQRMVDLAWKPALTENDVKSVRILYRNYVLLDVRVNFEYKLNPNRRLLKDMTLTAILEEKGWKFDLTQLIRVPFAGKFVDLEAEKKSADLAAKQEKEEALAKEEAIRAAWIQKKKDIEDGKVQATPEEEKRIQDEEAAKEAAQNPPEASSDQPPATPDKGAAPAPGKDAKPAAAKPNNQPESE